MYDNLVKRLRGQARLEREYNSTGALVDDAADAIEELQQKVEHYKGCADDWYKEACDYKALLSRWIPVKERLPDADGFTLIFTAHGNPGVCYFTNGWWGGYDKDGITHWMPLPQPPEEEKKND